VHACESKRPLPLVCHRDRVTAAAVQ
jgi:hypothetical protein